jgi:CheY-like chemotaxis protein/HPt (histidine-containing phosphotransfer) domain-containing protein
VNGNQFRSSPAGRADSERSGSRAPGLFPPSILVVDDDATNRAVAEGFLAQLGLRISFAADGQAAVETWRGGTFDLVLMDCMMPDVDGFQATAMIRKIESESGAPRTPIIALTAAASPEDKKKCFDAGMDDFVTKPIRRAQLAAALSRWLAPDGDPDEVAADLPSEPVEPADAAPILDHAALDPLRGVRVGGKSVLHRAVLSYVETTPQLISDLRLALEAGRWDDAHRFAHTIKSSSASLGARRLSELARSVELAAANRAEIPAPVLSSIETAYELAAGELADAFEQEPDTHGA